MSSKRCPICSDRFEAAGAVRDHAWDQHGACHYCGDQPEGAERTALYKHWLLAHPDDLRRVDEKQARSAVDSVSFGERLSAQGVGAAVGGLPRRYVLAAGGVTAALGVAGTGAVLSSASNGGAPGGANAVDESEYALIGSPDADATITYFGSYKCPHCADFNRGLFRQLHAEYIEPGALAVRYRNISFFRGRNFLGPDAANPGHAGLAVYDNEPASYRAYHDYIFENQPSGEWATADRLAEMARAAGVADPGVIRTAIDNDAYTDALDATDQAAQSAGVDSTPAVVIDGQVYNPLGQPSAVQTAIENVIE